jgi:dihydrofolate reductase
MPAHRNLPLTAVAAVGRNGAIGKDNRLPWSMPSDLAHFRVCTMGKPMIMGRLTFEAIGRALAGRESIVVTRSAGLSPQPGVWVADDPEQALALAQERAAAMGAPEVVLAGGATLFESMMPIVDRLRISVIDLAPAADTFFPPIDPAIWREASRVIAPRHPKDDAACVFVDYVRRDPMP